jgi:hypothetical protein
LNQQAQVQLLLQLPLSAPHYWSYTLQANRQVCQHPLHPASILQLP